MDRTLFQVIGGNASSRLHSKEYLYRLYALLALPGCYRERFLAMSAAETRPDGPMRLPVYHFRAVLLSVPDKNSLQPKKTFKEAAVLWIAYGNCAVLFLVQSGYEPLVAGEGLEPPRRCAVGYEPTPMTIFGQPAMLFLSGRRDLDPRLRTWKDRALPTELLPRKHGGQVPRGPLAVQPWARRQDQCKNCSRLFLLTAVYSSHTQPPSKPNEPINARDESHIKFSSL